jgi:hypothetical protein
MGQSASRYNLKMIVRERIDTYKIHKLAEREAPPNAEVVVHVYLADRHPLKVGANSVHLSKPKSVHIITEIDI